MQMNGRTRATPFANVDNNHPGGTAADGRAYQVGGWYRVVPTVRIFAGAGYQTA